MTSLTAYEDAIETQARTEPCPQCKAAAHAPCKRPGEHSSFRACIGRVRAAYEGRSDAPDWLTVGAGMDLKLCIDCGCEGPWYSRRLCKACYDKHRLSGTLSRFPKIREDVPADQRTPELAGVSYRQLDYWARLGYLRPQHAGGSGYWRQWSDDELLVARKMGALVAAGVGLATAERVARGASDVGNGVRIEITLPDAGAA
jgi:hypothetical protein